MFSFSPEFKATRSAHDKHWYQLFMLRAIQVPLVLISIIIISPATWSKHTVWEAHTEFLYVVQIPLYVVSLIFGAINFIHLRRVPHPMNPGWSVGVDLILWIGYIFTTLVAFLGFVEEIIVLQRCSATSDPQNIDWDDYFDYDSEGCYYTNGGLHIAGLVFMAFGSLAMLVIHFYLFVRGCIATHRVRKGRSLGPYQGAYAVPLEQNVGANISYTYQGATGKYT